MQHFDVGMVPVLNAVGLLKMMLTVIGLVCLQVGLLQELIHFQ